MSKDNERETVLSVRNEFYSYLAKGRFLVNRVELS